MENTQEKSADIIAEMRKSDCDEICPWWADGGSCDFCPLGRNGKNCSFSNYADRLEAALKREKAAKADVCGMAARNCEGAPCVN